MYDVVIVGAGPAGISAGIYAVSRGMKTVILEKNVVGGLIGKVSTVTHYASVTEVERVESLEISNEKTGAIETIEDLGCGIFMYAGTTPNIALYTELHLENGFIPVNEIMETEIPGVYAVGDIRVKQVRQVSTAVADGTIAAINAAM